MNTVHEGRIGKFTLSTEILTLGDQRGLRAIFGEMVVLGVQTHFVSNELEYTSAHPDFRIVGRGEIIPTYYCEVSEVNYPDGSWFVKWRELK